MKITLCSSASFYPHLNDVGDQLKSLGHEVLRPATAEANVRQVPRDNPDFWKWRKGLIDGHFQKIRDCDALLVINDEKRGVKGYIGPNVLMEITYAYLLAKQIFLNSAIDLENSAYEELRAIGVVVINGDLSRIK